MHLTEESNPNVSNIRKNIMAQKEEPGIVAMASGYTTNTSPGPSSATSSMFCPVRWAMYPSTEKITNPDTNDVQQLMQEVTSASL